MSQYLTPAARKLRGELQALAGRDRNAVKAVLGSMLADIVATEPDFIHKMGSDLVDEAFKVIAVRPDEAFIAVFFDKVGNLLKVSVYETGTKTRCVLYPRRVIQDALAVDATSVVIAHNHPSGDDAVSYADRELARRMSGHLEAVEISSTFYVVTTKGKRRVEYA